MKTTKRFTCPLIIIFLSILVVSGKVSRGQLPGPVPKAIQVGVAKVDITPEAGIRLAGYGARSKSESDGIIHRLEAKAMAFGSDAEHPSVLVTVDLVGVTERITARLRKQLSEKAGIDPAQVVICASHTHGGPEIGNLLNILQYRDSSYSDSLLPADHSIHIAQYTEMLSQKLEAVSLEALKNRRPALVSWGQGQAHFAANRRTEGGPVDTALPILRVLNPDGTLMAVFINYACHGTTFMGINEINADWIGEAKTIIETRHPGCMAFVAIGCGADADPKPRGSMDAVKAHGQEIADNVDKLITEPLQPLSVAPTGKIKWVRLPFANVPTLEDLIALVGEDNRKTTLKAYYARVALDRIERGETLPADVSLPVQVWNFGDELAMINLGGEVVVDYSIRLKNELGAEHVWINAYSNDVPCYIASRRVIREGGYEVDFSMYCYDKPSPLIEGAEDIVINAVHEIIPAAFKAKRDTINRPQTIVPQSNGNYYLAAVFATAKGPNTRYIPEWKALGGFTKGDKAEWEVNIDKAGKYAVYLQYSAPEGDRAKPFVLEIGNDKLKGKLEKTASSFTYVSKKAGVIHMSAGIRKIIFKPGSEGTGSSTINFSNIVLVPVH